MIKCIKHGKIRIICRITLDQHHPTGLKAPLDDIGFSGWYGIWYGFCHALFSIYHLTNSFTSNNQFVSILWPIIFTSCTNTSYTFVQSVHTSTIHFIFKTL
jgi:hypothetical protein